MYILIALFFSATNGGAVVSSVTQEFSSYNACIAAKQQIENSVQYSNYRSISCVAK